MKKENHSLTNFSLFFFFVPVILVTAFTESCTKITEFTIGDNFVESQTHIVTVDTFRIDMSTMLLDSLITSNQKIAYAGSYHDQDCGAVSSMSYFDLAYQTFDNLPTSAVFDSAAFVLTYSGFYAGDTTSLMTLGVHRVTEDMEHYYDDSYFYNTTKFNYSSDVLGTVRFYPAPNSTDTTISIPANYLGEELFNLILNNDEIVSSADWFNDYYKGFVLASEDPDNNIILGFHADEDHIFFKVYYHLDLESPVEKEISVRMGETNDQFNHIDFNFSGSAIDKIKAGGDLVSSSDAGNTAVLQGVVGLLPLVRFPTVQDFLLESRHKVLKAELVFEPAIASYDIYSLPDKLYLYETDKWENFAFKNLLKNVDGEAITSTLEADYMHGEITYTMDITDFIIEELSDGYFDYYHGLFIGLSQDKMTSDLSRLILETKDPAVKLRLYYITY
jgi:hypothetical protein